MKQSGESHRATRPTEITARSVVVPELGGMAVSDAVQQLRAVELVPGIEPTAVDAESDIGVVVDQDPAAGSDARAGAIVVLVVGQPREAPLAEDVPPAGPDLADDEWFDDLADPQPVRSEGSMPTEGSPGDAAGCDLPSEQRAETVDRPDEIERAGNGRSRPTVVQSLRSQRGLVAFSVFAVLLAFATGRMLQRSSPTATAPPATTAPAPPPPSPRTQRIERDLPRASHSEAVPPAPRHWLKRSRPSQRQATSADPAVRATAANPPSAALSQPPLPTASRQPARGRPHCEFCFESP